MKFLVGNAEFMIVRDDPLFKTSSKPNKRRSQFQAENCAEFDNVRPCHGSGG